MIFAATLTFAFVLTLATTIHSQAKVAGATSITTAEYVGCCGGGYDGYGGYGGYGWPRR